MSSVEASSPATIARKSSLEAVERNAYVAVESLDPFKTTPRLAQSPPPPSQGRATEGLPSRANTKQTRERQTTAMEVTPSQRRSSLSREIVNVTGAYPKRGRDSPERTTQQQRRRTQARNFNDIITEIHSILSKEKLTVDKRSILHASLGQLNSMYTELQTSNTILETENRILKQQKPKVTYAQSVASAPTQTRTEKINNTRASPKHMAFISAQGKTAKEVQKIFTQTVNPSKDKIKINNLKSTERSVIIETDTAEDIAKLVNLETLK